MLSVRRQNPVHAEAGCAVVGGRHLCAPILVSAGSLPGEASSSLHPSGHRISRNAGTTSLPSGLGILPQGPTGGHGWCGQWPALHLRGSTLLSTGRPRESHGSGPQQRPKERPGTEPKMQTCKYLLMNAWRWLVGFTLNF